jgi:hypothetical protein
VSDRVKNLLASVVSIGLLAVGAERAFFCLDRWGSHAFTRPLLASMLIAVLDLFVFGLALFAAPALSALLRKALRE